VGEWDEQNLMIVQDGQVSLLLQCIEKICMLFNIDSNHYSKYLKNM